MTRIRMISRICTLCCLSLTLSLFGCTGSTGGNANDNGGGDNANDNGGGDNANDNGDGGNANDNGDNANDNGGVVGLVAVNTGISIRHDSSVKSGEDFIMFGTGTDASVLLGVQWLIPSEGQTSGSAISGGDACHNSHFVVTTEGRKAVLLGCGGETFDVSIYDADTDTLTMLDFGEFRVRSIPVDEDDVGTLHADGSLVVVVNGHNELDDETNCPQLKVLDLSGSTPVIIEITNLEEFGCFNSFGFSSARVDAETRVVVAALRDVFYVFDIDNPTAAPTMYDRSGSDGINDDGEFQLSGENIMFHDSNSFGDDNVYILNHTTGAVTLVTHPPASDNVATGGNMAIGGDLFVYFLDRDTFDGFGATSRSAIGTLPDAVGVPGGIPGTTASDNDPSWEDFGTDTCVSPNGSYAFIAGDESINTSSFYLQVSTGGAFTPFAGETGGTDPFFTGTDPSCGTNAVAFRTGSNTDVVLGYVLYND